MKIAILTESTDFGFYKVWVTPHGRIAKDCHYIKGTRPSFRYATESNLGDVTKVCLIKDLGWLEDVFNPVSIEWEDLDIPDEFNRLPNKNEVPMFFTTFKPLAYDAKMLFK